MARSRVWAACGAILGASVVLAVMIGGNPGWGFLSHTDCQVGSPNGNLTVWDPSAVVSAPYGGSESGAVEIWTQTLQARLSILQDTGVSGGNVTAYFVGFQNWTIYAQQNVSMGGIGLQNPCLASVVGLLSGTPSQGLRSGGTTVWPLYSNLTSDTNLPIGLNGSRLCADVENTTYAGCAVGAEFDLNIQATSGEVNTCGSGQSQILRVTSQTWPVLAPFDTDGKQVSVPLTPSGATGNGYSNGTFAWYNYTFPANGGVWQYDNLADTSSTGAGLVFSYSPCS